MTFGKQEWTFVGIIGAIIFAGWYFRNPAIVNGFDTSIAAQPDSPPYLAFNYPKYPPSTAVLPGYSAPVSTGTPGCGCSPSATDNYAAETLLSDNFFSGLSNLGEQYRQAIMDTLPSYFTQYFGNVYGEQLSRDSRTALIP